MAKTANEPKVIRYLAASIGKDHSINEIARACKITPNGTYKILNKFKRMGVFKVRPIANIRSYTLDFESEKTRPHLELALTPDPLEGRMKARAEDFQRLKKITKACVLFGSYITTKEKPGDLDVLFVLEKKEYNHFKDTLDKIQDITPVKIQDVVQTPEDLTANLRKGDIIVTTAIQRGIVIWGASNLAEIIKHAHE